MDIFEKLSLKNCHVENHHVRYLALTHCNRNWNENLQLNCNSHGETIYKSFFFYGSLDFRTKSLDTSKNDFQMEFPLFLPICICSIYEIMGNSICKSFFEGYKHSNKSILLSLSFSLPMRRMYECSFLSMSIWARDTRHLHKRSHLLHGTFYLEISHSKKKRVSQK